MRPRIRRHIPQKHHALAMQPADESGEALARDVPDRQHQRLNPCWADG